MKFLKSKITVALLITIISFGAFSFTTTPVNAQGTISNLSPVFLQQVPQLPAQALAEEQALHAAGRAARVATRVATAVVTSLVTALVFGETSGEQLGYPADSLDRTSKDMETKEPKKLTKSADHTDK